LSHCRAAARLSLDPYSDAAPYEPGILQAVETLSGQVLTDFLNAVSPEHIERALAWISSVRPAIDGRQPLARGLEEQCLKPVDLPGMGCTFPVTE
jgi:hypothetical protein